MVVHFSDLQAQYRELKQPIYNAMQEVLEDGNYILGYQLQEFEKNFAEYCGVKYCVGLSSGTEAIELALRTLGIGDGDEVVLPASTFIATALGVSATGAKVVVCDVDEKTHLIDIDSLHSVITDKTKLVIPVDLFGQIDGYAIEYCEVNKIPFICDACQSHGAKYLDKKSGSLGLMSAFSFYPAKNLGGITDGGCITTNNEDYYNHLIKLRNYGSSKKYVHDFKGKNARMDTINAAVLNEKLYMLDKWNVIREWAASQYLRILERVNEIELPERLMENKHVFHLFVIKAKRRDDLKKYLDACMISTGIHYPVPIHKQEAYSELNHLSLPVSERLASEMLSLPMHPYLTLQEIEFVCDKIKEFYQ